MESWKMTIKLEGKDFAYLKNTAAEILNGVVAARTYKDLPIGGAGSSGQHGNDYGYSIEYSCPVQQRVADLRAEAAALEAGLKS